MPTDKNAITPVVWSSKKEKNWAMEIVKQKTQETGRYYSLSGVMKTLFRKFAKGEVDID